MRSKQDPTFHINCSLFVDSNHHVLSWAETQVRKPRMTTSNVSQADVLFPFLFVGRGVLELSDAFVFSIWGGGGLREQIRHLAIICHDFLPIHGTGVRARLFSFLLLLLRSIFIQNLRRLMQLEIIFKIIHESEKKTKQKLSII